MREYEIKMLIRKVMNENAGNPYHDEKGKFTFSPSGVGASFYKPNDYYTRPDVKTTVGTYGPQWIFSRKRKRQICNGKSN